MKYRMLSHLPMALAISTIGISPTFADVVTNFTLNTATIGTWTRPNGGGNYDYVYQYFTPSVSGSHTFGMDSSAFNDPYMVLYSGAFDPTQPLLNYLTEDDDSNPVSTACSGYNLLVCPQLTTNLAAGTNYYLVITTFSNGAPIVLPLNFFVSGPAAVGVGGQPPAGLFLPNADILSSGAAQTLDDLRATASGDMATAIGVLNALTPTAQSTALAQIAPQTNEANESAVHDFNRSVLDSISNRLHRAQGERGLAPALAQQALDTSLMLADNSANAGTGLGKLAGTGQYGLWLQAFGSKSSQDLHASYSGFDANTSGLTIGADTLLASDWVVGSAFSYGRTDVSQQDYRNGDSSDIDTYQLTAYASRDFGLWYLDGMLGYAQQQYQTKRNTSVAGIAKGDFDGEQLLAKVEAGYPIALGKQLTLTPLAGLEWNRLELDSYHEKDAGPLALQVRGEHSERIASNLGARLEMAIDLEHGATLYPSTHARWVHQFDNDGIDTTAAFIGGGSSFVTPGQQLAEDSYIVGVGLTLQQASGSSVSLQLDTQQATARSSYAGQLEAQWLF